MAEHWCNPLRPRQRFKLTRWRKLRLWRQQPRTLPAAGRKRAEEAKRIKLITKRSVEAEISRTIGAAHKAAQAQFNIASRVPLSLRPAYPKHKANKAAAWAARVAHGGGVATGLRADESRERLRAAMHRWRLRRAERRLTN
jgi:hypothetical protein